LKAIAAALGQDESVFQDVYNPLPNQLLKIIRYPGLDVAESSQGVGPHKDGGLVTVLLQDTVAGLRVQTETGDWIDAPPVPGTFVINTGELLELATDGYVRANVHDVVAPPAGVERFSIAFFLGARLDATVPLIELPEGLQRFKRGVSTDPLNPLFREVGRNAMKSRLRSHPDVARRHHADLLFPELL
jgi:isopenicillin N synthase-like dioxygenase